jgi:selT/selW/selH-like putative selenoprotein
LSAHLQEAHGGEVELIRGAGGAFEVRRNGALLFSKMQEGRFPTHTEIDALIAGV